MTRRFFADSASWNRTIEQRGGRRVGYDDYPQRFLTAAFGPEPSAKGKVIPKFNAYSVAVLDAAEADYTCGVCKGSGATAGKTCTICKGRKKIRRTVKVAQPVWAQNQQTLGNTPVGSDVPWSMQWGNPADPTQPNRMPGGTDRCVVIVDYETGEAWELWRALEPHAACVDWFWILKAFGGPNGKAGFTSGNTGWLGAAGLNKVPSVWTGTDGTTVASRGMKINKLALTVMAEELASGTIPHSLPLTLCNPMYGPMAKPPVGNSAPGAGVTSGFYLPPATGLEYGAKMPPTGPDGTTVYRRELTIPSGMTFGFDITAANLTRWLDTYHPNSVEGVRTAARAFAEGWRDRGATAAETGGWGVGIECEAATSPKPAAVYREMGLIPADPKAKLPENPSAGLLDGLLGYGTLYVAS